MAEAEASGTGQPDGRSSRSSGSSFPKESVTTITQTVLAFVGVVIILVYPIGFASFWIQLWRYYDLDLSTALYAASTVPSTVLAGNLVNILKSLVLSGGIALTVFMFTPSYYMQFRSALSRKERVIIFVGLVGLFLLLALEALSWGFIFTIRSLSDVLWYALFLVFAFGGGMLGGYLGYLALRERSSWGLIRAQALVYLAAVVGALVLSGLQIPALPTVEFNSEGHKEGEILSLLSHSDGYWYVIDRQGNLSAVPGDGTGSVRFLRK